MISRDIIPFSKYQGTGNDFIVIDNRENLLSLKQASSLAPRMCKRRYGIGADGIMLLNTSSDPALDYTMVYRNADGSNAGMCGNGARCLALYAGSLGMGSEFNFNVHNNIYRAAIMEDDHVQISFPMKTKVKEMQIKDYPAVYRSHPGTEHIAVRVKEAILDKNDKLKEWGRELRYADEFEPLGTNVNFIYGESEDSLQLQTYERGVEDLTLACGTGAIASALTWHHLQEAETARNKYKVSVKGGSLTVSFSYNGHEGQYLDIRLAGPAKRVFTGKFHV